MWFWMIFPACICFCHCVVCTDYSAMSFKFFKPTPVWNTVAQCSAFVLCGKLQLWVVITNFWSIVLNDHWSKTIYRPNMIVRSGVLSHPSMILFFEDGRKMNMSFAFLLTEYLLLWSPNIWCLHNSLWAVRTNFKVWMFIICILHSWQISPYLYSDGAGP